MITIKVAYEASGEPWENQRAAIGTAWGVTEYEYTDRNGEVHFDLKPTNGKVYVNGNVVHEGYLSGRVVGYI